MSKPNIKQIVEIVNSKKYLENKDAILDILKNKELRAYFWEKNTYKFDNLEEANFILEELLKDPMPFDLSHVLENNIERKNNAYIIDFIDKHYEDLGKDKEKNYTDKMFQQSMLRVVIKKIVESDKSKIKEIVAFLEKLIKSRNYKKRDREFGRNNSDREQERDLIGEILLEISKLEREKELIEIIDDNFDLISDDMRFALYTPNTAFSILKNYIIGGLNLKEEFEKRFKEIVEIIINQYISSDSYNDKTGKNQFEGYEWWGGCSSQSGSHFSISDRHFVELILRPALDEYYLKNPKEAFEFINSFCIYKDSEGKIKVSKEKPDFLLRASIGIILSEYAKENETAKGVLKDFIEIEDGYPKKRELIFQDLHNNAVQLPDDKKWDLLEISFTENKGLPSNVFVSKIAADLAAKTFSKAINKIVGWLKNDDYYKQLERRDFTVTEMIDSLLIGDYEKGVEGFKNYIGSEYFKIKLDYFEAYDAGKTLNNILNNNDKFVEGLKILKDLSSKEKLEKNEQIVLCNGLIRSKGNGDDENEKVLMRIYNEFLWPFLSKDLKKDIKRDYEKQDYGLVYNKLNFSNAREQIVQFAERLARKKKIKEAISIIQIFVNDPDPFTPARPNPEDTKGEYDEHKRIVEGEGDVHAITTVRGWCGWTLLQCSVLAGRPYIKEMIKLSRQLIEDENLFVASYGATALSGLAQNRLTVMPTKLETEKRELFFGYTAEEALENAKEVEDITFEFLNRISKLGEKTQKNMADPLLRVLGHIRSLNESKAKYMLEKLLLMDSKVVSEAAPLFIFFAEFRKEAFKNWRWGEKGSYDDLIDFNDSGFKELLKKAMKKDKETKMKFAWHFYSLPREQAVDYDKTFNISLEYLKELVDKYDPEVFRSVYMFVENNIEKKFDECYDLWENIAKKEVVYYQKLEKEKRMKEIDIRYPSLYFHEKILSLVHKCRGNEKFLDSLILLLTAPEIIRNPGNDITNIILSIPAPNEKVEKIFDRLAVNNIIYSEMKDNWAKGDGKK
ncbi:MAG: hypothetical protein WC735_04625 [Candidatus Paceibacterota bacterium]|jgi:hypothetical protein